jgi:hypothetical protein
VAYVDLDHTSVRTGCARQSNHQREVDADGDHRLASVGEHDLLPLCVLDDLGDSDRTTADDDDGVVRASSTRMRGSIG